MKRKLVLLVFAIVMFMLAAPFIYIGLNRASVPSTNLPIPNGFDTLNEAEGLLKDLPKEDLDTITAEAITSCLANNEDALALIEKATHEGYAVPIDYQAGLEAAMDLRFRRPLALSRLEIRLAEIEGRTDDQAKLLVRLLELSSRLKNDGLLLHLGPSVGHERRCLVKLVEIAPNIGAAARAEVRDRVAKLDRGPTDFEAVMEREHFMVEQEHGFRGTYMLWVMRNYPNEGLDNYKEIDAEVVSMSAELLKLLK